MGLDFGPWSLVRVNKSIAKMYTILYTKIRQGGTYGNYS